MAEWRCVLVKEISVATNERVSFTRSGMWKRVKRGEKENKCGVCVYDLASVCSESMNGPRSVYPAPLQPVQRIPT
jgi:hypothetical protein